MSFEVQTNEYWRVSPNHKSFVLTHLQSIVSQTFIDISISKLKSEETGLPFSCSPNCFQRQWNFTTIPPSWIYYLLSFVRLLVEFLA